MDAGLSKGRGCGTSIVKVSQFEKSRGINFLIYELNRLKDLYYFYILGHIDLGVPVLISVIE